MDFKSSVSENTDIHQRFQTSYTAPYNGLHVVSHGAQFGGLRVFADHIPKKKRKTNAIMIFTHLGVSVFMLRPQQMQVTYTHLTNRDYFDYGKNPKTLNLSPMPGSRWRRFLDL